MNILKLALAAALLCAPMAATPANAQTAAAAPQIVIHHIEGRTSEAVVWVLEELGLPYKLDFKPGDLGASAAAIRQAIPLLPMDPNLTIGPLVTMNGQTLVSPSAAVDLILARYGQGRLQPPKDSPDFAPFKMWMYYAEGSLASDTLVDYKVAMALGGDKMAQRNEGNRAVAYAEAYLAKGHPYFGGAQFSAADALMYLPFENIFRMRISEQADYPLITAWMAKVRERPAFKRMLAAARPNPGLGAPVPLKVGQASR
jgi:glutathione S-transferase